MLTNRPIPPSTCCANSVFSTCEPYPHRFRMRGDNQGETFADGSDHKTAFPGPHRHASGPARSDIGKNHRLRKATGRGGAGVGHESTST